MKNRVAIPGWSALLVLVCLLQACQPSFEDSMLTLDEAWIRAVPPSMKMTAGFGQLTNSSGREVEISGFSSP